MRDRSGIAGDDQSRCAAGTDGQLRGWIRRRVDRLFAIRDWRMLTVSRHRLLVLRIDRHRLLMLSGNSVSCLVWLHRWIGLRHRSARSRCREGRRCRAI